MENEMKYDPLNQRGTAPEELWHGSYADEHWYGSYISLVQVTDQDEFLRKLIESFPKLVHQMQLTCHAAGLKVNFDTLQFIVHTGPLGHTLGWKCRGVANGGEIE